MTEAERVLEATDDVWKKKYGKFGVSELLGKRRQLRDEKMQLKRLVADLTLD